MYNDFVEGEFAVKERGETYLPRPSSMDRDKEGNAEYHEYIERAEFFNAVGRTRDGLKGLITRKPPVVNNVADNLLQYLDDVDGKGNSFEHFVSDVLGDYIPKNWGGILCDAPEGGDGISVKEAEQENLSPFMAFYKAEDIINWHFNNRGRSNVLEYVVLKETYEQKTDSPFKRTQKTRYRALYLDQDGNYTQAVYLEDTSAPIAIIVPKKYGKPRKDIPFYFLGTEPRKSILEDLIQVNKSWYQINADYKSGLHYVSVPVPYTMGFTPQGETKYDKKGNPYQEDVEPVKIKSSSFIHFPEGCTGVGMLEFGGSGMSELRTAMGECEDRMAILGARIISQEHKGVESAETAKIHRAGENSVLAGMANEVSDTLSLVLDDYLQWCGNTENVDCDVHLNTDYEISKMSTAELTAYVSAWQAGAISKKTMFNNLKEGEIVEATKTFEEEQAEIDEDEKNRMASMPQLPQGEE